MPSRAHPLRFAALLLFLNLGIAAAADVRSYAIDSGFWAFAAAVQMPDAPLLSLQRTSATTFTISWPSPATGFVLQSTTDLATPNWTTVAATPTDDGATKTVVIDLAQANQFFRLIRLNP